MPIASEPTEARIDQLLADPVLVAKMLVRLLHVLPEDQKERGLRQARDARLANELYEVWGPKWDALSVSDHLGCLLWDRREHEEAS